jgi:ferritin-like metal-binding protein YciE
MATSKEMTLDDLFLDTLKDIYYAEKQIVKALPKMAKAAQDPNLKAGFEKHMDETQGHIDRLEQVFELIGKPARGKTCDAILGILEEGKSIIEDYKGTVSIDAGLIAAGQAVEHYEMARYGTLRTWATRLGYAEAAKLLETTLLEERATDQALTKLAEAGGDNAKAA